ncbi:MAG TPA: alpha/beta hydrolase [Firmicutes bacterium]|nr:alpha/beta hydrolase [Bacillota bacterium]
MTQLEWQGFKRLDFDFNGRQAILVIPPKPHPEGKWMIKTEYFGAFPELELELLKRGLYLGYVPNITRWSTDEDQDIKSEFINYISYGYGLKNKCLLIGMSCGGLHAAELAARHPENVSALYLDAPVLNLLSCPGGVGISTCQFWDEFYAAKGISMSQLICYRNHPIDKMDIFIKHELPVYMVYGDKDSTVPYCENGAILEKYYHEHGGTLITECKAGFDHHPHGPKNIMHAANILEKWA